MACIFCGDTINLNTVEHIVSESLGNTQYILPKGDICDECNRRFSDFESKALGKTILGYERARLGHKTKKGKPGKGKTGDIEFIGHEEFKKNMVRVKGLDLDQLTEYDPQTNTFIIKVDSFDKSEVATSKLLLKMAFEALYKSNRRLWKKYNFDDLKDFLLGKSTIDWPFIMPLKELAKFTSIPKMGDKHVLNRIPCRLFISEVDENNLIFRFEYGGKKMAFEINLLNRDLGWIKPHVADGNIYSAYPKHFNKQLGIKTEGDGK